MPTLDKTGFDRLVLLTENYAFKIPRFLASDWSWNLSKIKINRIEASIQSGLVMPTRLSIFGVLNIQQRGKSILELPQKNVISQLIREKVFEVFCRALPDYLSAEIAAGESCFALDFKKGFSRSLAIERKAKNREDVALIHKIDKFNGLFGHELTISNFVIDPADDRLKICDAGHEDFIGIFKKYEKDLTSAFAEVREEIRKLEEIS